MTETRHIDSALEDTGENTVGALSSWIDPDTQTSYETNSIPWCLMTSIQDAIDDHEETRPGTETIKVWLGRVVGELIDATLTDNSCTAGEADDYDTSTDWDVLVVRSQPDGDTWGEVVGSWYAHPTFQGKVVAARSAGGGNLQVLSITSHEVT